MLVPDLLSVPRQTTPVLNVKNTRRSHLKTLRAAQSLVLNARYNKKTCVETKSSLVGSVDTRTNSIGIQQTRTNMKFFIRVQNAFLVKGTQVLGSFFFVVRLFQGCRLGSLRFGRP